MISARGLRCPALEQGEEGAARRDSAVAQPAPPSPFMDDGKCWSCGGFGEHTAGCPHARDWERFGGGL